ncbi:uncharacterized protein LOC130813400 [Amaranthus tricolor]|uniref:uncharacterized protein LOC130813400 n=1 Tax=Amaranthus tricolor TaxID=29722 RepID=UPI002583FE87|nr:uncharacterized protein LOC130813400 [Amaranthus tricolor]
MANQIKKLKVRIEPTNPSSQKSDDRDTQVSRSSKRNKKRRKRSKIQKNLSKGKEEEESKSETQDVRSYLNKKRARQSHSIQSFVDKNREERKDDLSQGGPQEAPMLVNSLFSTEILTTPNPDKIKIPNMNLFDRTKCLEEHIVAYKNLMLLYTTNQALWCKFFPTTLSGVALIWYTSLPVGSIHTFTQLEAKFAILEVTDLEDFVALNALINGMRTPKLKFQLIKNQVKMYAKTMGQCQSYITPSQICHTHDSKKRKHDKSLQGQSHPQKIHKDELQSRREKGYPPRHHGSHSKMGPSRSRHIYIMEEEPRARNLRDRGENPRFNRNRRDIFYAIQDELLAPPPTTIPSECRKLRRFLNWKEYGSRGDNERPYHPKHKPPKDEERKDISGDMRGVINMIIGGFSEDYPTLRAARGSVHTLLKGPPKAIMGGLVVKFNATISKPLQQPHIDSLIVTIKIGQMKVKRVLIDTGSTTDLITMDFLSLKKNTCNRRQISHWRWR